MIEVLFGESEAASMKAGKCTVMCHKTDGPTSVWMAGKKKPPEREGAGWIEGTQAEVICLGFALDIGDIREEADSDYRNRLLYSLYSHGQWEEMEEANEELKNLGRTYAGELERLKGYLDEGEKIRIWYSEAPYSLCGLYHLCTILAEYENEIRVVPLPKYKVCSGSVIVYQNWGDVSADEFAGFLIYERELSREEIRMYRAKWNELKEEGSMLRAVINGRLIGVPEEFYDFLILGMIGKKPVKEARLIGNIMGKTQLSIGDWWYSKRIDRLIGEGKIEIIEDSVNKYARLICLAQQK